VCDCVSACVCVFVQKSSCTANTHSNIHALFSVCVYEELLSKAGTHQDTHTRSCSRTLALLTHHCNRQDCHGNADGSYHAQHPLTYNCAQIISHCEWRDTGGYFIRLVTCGSQMNMFTHKYITHVLQKKFRGAYGEVNPLYTAPVYM